jgi:hypothetical protein
MHANFLNLTTRYLLYWEFVSFDWFSEWEKILFLKVINPFNFINILFCEVGIKLLCIIQLNSPSKY